MVDIYNIPIQSFPNNVPRNVNVHLLELNLELNISHKSFVLYFKIINK